MLVTCVIYIASKFQHLDNYIYTLERSFCLMINIMIDIRHISRCVIQIFKSVRFILHVSSLDYSLRSVHVKNLSPTAP